MSQSSPAASPPPAEGAPKSTPGRNRKKVVDFTLASKLEASSLVRDLLREKDGGLIKWVNKEKTNVISLETLGLNSGVMSIVAEHVCSADTAVKTPSIAFFKAQAQEVPK